MVNLDLAARLIRRSLRRAAAQRRFPNTPLDRMPILFGNSFPKSGTHLLTQVLAGFAPLGPVVESGLPPVLTFEGESGKQRSPNAIRADLGRLLPGDIAYGHLHATPEAQMLLCRPGVAPYFIYRDPRDVAVSHVFYVTEFNERHVHHDYYINRLNNFDERLTISIRGLPELRVPFPDIRTRFEPYLPWLERSEVLSLRYEDLVTDLHQGIREIFDHALKRGFVYTSDRETAVDALANTVNPQSSPTFRSGKTGEWKQHFTSEHKKLFKDLSGDLLVRLGYEQNQNW